MIVLPDPPSFATLDPMTYGAEENRPLYQQVVDDIQDQIASGQLGPDDKVPSAKVISETYGIANMTAQRALRELQNLGITYGQAGRGSFVRPEAALRLATNARAITNDADYRATMAEFRQGADKANADLNEALATGDVTRIIDAKTAVEHYWNTSAPQVRELARYTQRVKQAGRNVEDIYTSDN